MHPGHLDHLDHPADLPCGRFDLSLQPWTDRCGRNGHPAPELLDTLRGHGPNAVIGDRMPPPCSPSRASPTPFGLDQADANARAIAATGAPLAVRTDGGHDARSATQAQDDAAAEAWLGTYVKAETKTGPRGFPCRSPPHLCAPGAPARAHRPGDAPRHAGIGRGRRHVVHDPARRRHGLEPHPHPPGGQPASTTSIPGLAAAGLTADLQLAVLPAVGPTWTRDVQRMTIVGHATSPRRSRRSRPR